MLRGISDVTVKDIRNRMYELLDEYGDSTYDYHHVRRVESQCAWLAMRRGLDINIAETIGLLHDVGRIEEYVTGKKHSTVGAKIAKRWLSEYPIEDNAAKVIINAIGKHNSKKKIGDEFEELIKDADSLAHADEFSLSNRIHESIRVRCSLQIPLRFSLTSQEEINSILLRDINILYKRLKNLKTKTISEKDVHSIRVSIRSICSIISMLKGTRQWKDYRALYKDLKKVFKLFETSRKLTVFKNSLIEAGLTKKDVKIISTAINVENEKAIRKLVKLRNNIGKSLRMNDWKIHAHKEMKNAFNLKVHQYKRSLQNSNSKSIESIHNLRIQGKLFKYLIEDGIVIVNNVINNQNNILDIKLIDELHNSIGKIHDVMENKFMYKQYFESGKSKMKPKKVLLVKRYYSKLQKAEQKNLKIQIFHIRKRFEI